MESVFVSIFEFVSNHRVWIFPLLITVVGIILLTQIFILLRK